MLVHLRFIERLSTF